MTDTKENTIDKNQVIKEIHDLFSKDQFSAAVERLKLLGPDFDCKEGTLFIKVVISRRTSHHRYKNRRRTKKDKRVSERNV